MVIYSHQVNGDVRMDYRIEAKEAWTVAGYAKEISKVEGKEDFFGISRFWSGLTEEEINQLMSVTDGTIQGLLGVSDSNQEKQERFNYLIATRKSDKRTAASSLELIQIPKSDWAIVECVGAISAGVTALDDKQSVKPNALMQLKVKTSVPWEMGGSIENTQMPRIEFYPLGDMTAEEYKCELWIPIKTEKR